MLKTCIRVLKNAKRTGEWQQIHTVLIPKTTGKKQTFQKRNLNHLLMNRTRTFGVAYNEGFLASFEFLDVTSWVPQGSVVYMSPLLYIIFIADLFAHLKNSYKLCANGSKLFLNSKEKLKNCGVGLGSWP